MTLPAGRHLAGAAAPPAGDYDADIVILSYDRAQETVAAIRSALDQRGLSRHVCVLDQGSAPAALAAVAAAVAGRADATLLALDANAGVAGGRNIASAFGHGRMIAALDNDAVYDAPDVLRRARDAFAADAALAAIGFRVLTGDGTRDDAAAWGYPRALLSRAGGRFAAVTFVGAGHALRRRAWDDAGGYDARLFFTWEEYDFALRAIARGWRIAYHGDLAVRHAGSAERRVAWSGRRWFYSVRNRLLIARKWGASWPALAPRCAGYLLRGLLHGALWQTLRGIAAAARLGRPAPPDRLGPAARGYLAAHDGAHRGGLRHRLRTEVWRPYAGVPPLAGSAAGAAGGRRSRARSSSSSTGGLSSR